MIDVFNRNGKIKATCKKIEYQGSFLGECFVTVSIHENIPNHLEVGDYLFFRGEKFVLNYQPAVKKQGKRGAAGNAFVYDSIKFNSLADELTRVEFLDVVPNNNNRHYTSLPDFSFYASSVKDLADRLQANLDREYKGADRWVVIVSPDVVSPDKHISINKMTCWQALSLASSEFGVNFIIRNRTVTIGTSGLAVGKVFGYGKGKGLVDIQQTTNEDAMIITRLRAYGSTKNLPYKYYNRLKNGSGKPYVSESAYIPHLMLPDFPYKEADPSKVFIESDTIQKYGIREGSVYFDGSNDLPDIFPSLEGMTKQQLSAAGIPVSLPPGDNGNLDECLSAENPTDNGELPEEGKGKITDEFVLYLKDLGFDLTAKDSNGQYKYASGETMQIHLKSGMCVGRTFDVVDKGIVKDTSLGYVRYRVRCKRAVDDSIAGGTAFPNSRYRVGAKDKLVVLGIEMPEVYVRAASQRVLTAARDFLALHNETKYTYVPSLDEIFMANHPDIGEKIKEGDIFNFKDTDLNIDGSVIIQSLKIRVGDKPVPVYEVTLSNERITGTIEKIQNAISQLVTNNTGVTLEQVKSVILSVGSHYFLSRLHDDTAEGLIAFVKDVSMEKSLTVHDTVTVKRAVVSDQFGNDTFTSGQFGSGFRVWKNPANGQSYAEFDNLMVRRETIFNVLTIAEIRSVNGQILVSPANMVCSGVEEVSNGYICFFDTADGTIHNQFVVNDQAICRSWNGKNIKYYWRRVVEVGEDYILLSKTDADGSSVPDRGDDIIQFGNRTELNRQSAIIISAYGSDAPSIKQYSGINSYDLTGKEVTVISPAGNKFTGTFSVKTGNDTVRVPADKGIWKTGLPYYYYDRVSHGGGLWLCVVPDGFTTTQMPSENSVHWQKQVSEGKPGEKGEAGTLNFIEWRDEWKVGNVLLPNWGNNGAQSKNVRIVGENPFGVHSVLWKCVPDATGYNSGGWNTSYKQLDTAYAYRYTVFVYRNKAGGVTYHGCYNVLNIADNSVNSNPYFWSSESLKYGEWLLMVGYIHPYSVTKQPNMSGVYDLTGKKIANGIDFKFTQDSKAVNFRSYLFYCTDPTVYQLFYNPMVHRLDGTEPGIEEILQVSSRKVVDASFEILDDKISKKVSQTDFNSLQGRVSSTESKVEQQAGQITSTVEKVEGKNSVYKSYSNGSTDRPAVPYAKGDLWITYEGEIKQSKNTRVSGAFVASDWVNTTKYTDDSAVNNLQIGGRNILTGTGDGKGWNGYIGNRTFQYTAARNVESGYIYSPYFSINGNETYTLSFETKNDVKINSRDLYILSGKYTTNNAIISKVFDKSTDWTKFVWTFKTPAAFTGVTDVRLRVDHNGSTDASSASIWIRNVKLEIGSKATDWSPAPEDVQKEIDETKTALNNTQLTAENATELAKAMSYGKMLYKDPTFLSGNNGVGVYNNNSNGMVTIERIAKIAGAPTSSTHCLRIRTIGVPTTPGFGGFCFAHATRANAKYICRFIALIPSGFTVSWHSNHTGDGRVLKWLTPVTGSGKWQEYICMLTCGSSGTFSTTSFFALNGSFSPSASNPIIWYLSYATVIDITDSEINYDANRTYYSDSTPAVPAGGHKVGDLWYKISLSNGCYLTYRWNGSSWVQINVNVSKSKIDQTDSSISTLVSKTGINSLGSGETLFSKINQTADKITLEVNKVQIGGRNYVLGSNLYITAANSSRQFDFAPLSDFNELRGKQVTVSVDIELSGGSGNRIGFEPSLRFSDGTTQYLSCWHTIAQGKNYKGRLSKTYTITNKVISGFGQKGIYIQCTGTVTKIGRPMIELGNKMSDYIPAPEDAATIAGSSLTLTNNKITLGSKTIELNGNVIAKSIEAGDLKVGSRTGTYALEVLKSGVFYAKGTSGTSSLEIDSQNRRITLTNSQSVYTDTGGSKSVTQTVSIRASDGYIESRNSDGHVAYLTSQGILANRAGINPYSATTGVNLKAAIMGLGFGQMNKTSWGNNWGLVGVFGRASNSSSAADVNRAPAYGGWFDVCKINGLCMNVRRISGSTTLSRHDFYVSCYNSSDINVYLPSNPYEGQMILVRRVNSSNIRYYGNGKSIHVDGGLHSNLWHKGRGDTCVFIFDGQYWMFNYWVR